MHQPKLKKQLDLVEPNYVAFRVTQNLVGLSLFELV